jgi:hypothetical protein
VQINHFAGDESDEKSDRDPTDDADNHGFSKKRVWLTRLPAHAAIGSNGDSYNTDLGWRSAVRETGKGEGAWREGRLQLGRRLTTFSIGSAGFERRL